MIVNTSNLDHLGFPMQVQWSCEDAEFENFDRTYFNDLSICTYFFETGWLLNREKFEGPFFTNHKPGFEGQRGQIKFV